MNSTLKNTANIPSKEHFLDDWKRFTQRYSNDALAQLRMNSLHAFRELSYPNRTMEEWRHTDIMPIVKTPYRVSMDTPIGNRAHKISKWHELGNNDSPELVFLNGSFSYSFSKGYGKSIFGYLGGIHEALLNDEAECVRNHLAQHAKKHTAYTALNTAFLNEGAYVRITRAHHPPSPICLRYVTTAHTQPTVHHLRNLFIIEENASATIVLHYLGRPDVGNYLNNVVEEIYLGKNAQLHLCVLVDEGNSGNHLRTQEISLHRDSRLNMHTVTLNGERVRNQSYAYLVEENAQVEESVLVLNDADRMVDNDVHVHHLATHGTSRITAKGILADQSKTVFRGKVYVAPDAQKTDSNQINQSLLLSNKATIDSKPQLEIYADDVKCTHGATVGAPPEEVLFYFRSRGISEANARAMLTCGFANSMINEIPVSAVRKMLSHEIAARYESNDTGKIS